MDQELTAMGVTSASDLRSIPLATLTKIFGERTAKYMYSACRGEVGLQDLIMQCVQSQVCAVQQTVHWRGMLSFTEKFHGGLEMSMPHPCRASLCLIRPLWRSR